MAKGLLGWGGAHLRAGGEDHHSFPQGDDCQAWATVLQLAERLQEEWVRVAFLSPTGARGYGWFLMLQFVLAGGRC